MTKECLVTLVKKNSFKAISRTVHFAEILFLLVLSFSIIIVLLVFSLSKILAKLF